MNHSPLLTQMTELWTTLNFEHRHNRLSSLFFHISTVPHDSYLHPGGRVFVPWLLITFSNVYVSHFHYNLTRDVCGPVRKLLHFGIDPLVKLVRTCWPTGCAKVPLRCLLTPARPPAYIGVSLKFVNILVKLGCTAARKCKTKIQNLKHIS